MAAGSPVYGWPQAQSHVNTRGASSSRMENSHLVANASLHSTQAFNDLAIVESVSNPLDSKHIAIVRKATSLPSPAIINETMPQVKFIPALGVGHNQVDQHNSQQRGRRNTVPLSFHGPIPIMPPTTNLKSAFQSHTLSASTSGSSGSSGSKGNQMSKKEELLERNRRNAKLHRLKHKERVSNMEARLIELTTENAALKRRVTQLENLV